MRVTFPYMGTTIIYKKLLELLGHEVIEPPIPSQRTIDLGVKNSPEFACYPLKVILGSYIEAIELGATTIVDLLYRESACTGVPICAATPTIAKPANTLANTFFLPLLFLAVSGTTT